MGIGGLIVVGLITWLLGGNPLDVLRQGGGEIVTQQTAQEEPYSPTAEEEEMATFAKVILKGTEDAWTEIFAKYGKTYTPPRMVLYTDAVQSGCGGASSQVGPFYCSADQTLYIDLSFFNQMKTQLGAGGDFAYAYVIAHEVGHHVQNLLGTLDKAHARMAQVSKTEANAISVRLELQADYYAGMWAHYDDARFGSLEPGDIEEGINAAHAIGDDKLQMEAQGYVVAGLPERADRRGEDLADDAVGHPVLAIEGGGAGGAVVLLEVAPAVDGGVSGAEEAEDRLGSTVAVS